MLGRIVEALARLMAVLGGLVLTGLIGLTCASVAGRAINGWMHADWVETTLPALSGFVLGLGVGPINGDFELVEAGMAFVIFAFLPITQLTGAHASVDIFTRALGPRVNGGLMALWALVFAAVLILIARQLWLGTEAKMRYGETTYLIQFPIWWAYAAALSGAVVAAFAACYVAAVRVAELVTGALILPSEEADH
ncbi:TRAP transporter small permease [Jannaschia ovalis]|uniref:TRAP transporter small permease protein n=1 Tax=Jannaschia ovalis TaxID=3038773 RepID=A0ABY8LIW9_9RHOB|nr:TRAP transporter small permease [Jannaschia sp. GRR-S6-38]WGH80105.1 TRAP transporter small permease [Jannaschia sp. GRR-S6-38]